MDVRVVSRNFPLLTLNELVHFFDVLVDHLVGATARLLEMDQLVLILAVELRFRWQFLELLLYFRFVSLLIYRVDVIINELTSSFRLHGY